MFVKDKEYTFSLEKYIIDCAKDQIPTGDWATILNGCRVVPSGCLTYGKWAGHIIIPTNTPVGIMIQKAPQAFKFDIEWCEEK